ncbi:MAG: type III pantothenate kinase, partial [Pseudomonadota bacterium]
AFATASAMTARHSTGPPCAAIRLQKLEVEITDVIISSTVPRVVFNLRVLCDRYFNCRPLVVGKPECALPVEPRVDEGTQIGPDRLVNTAGAFDRYGGDLIVVDFGTATTFDVVASDGAYVGGVIAPGVNLSLEALHNAAAALPHVDISKPQAVVGTNTVACMQSGVFWGYVGLVREICARIKAERARDMRVISTGGLAPLFQQSEPLFDAFEDDLTMHGLTVIHRFNKDKS